MKYLFPIVLFCCSHLLFAQDWHQNFDEAVTQSKTEQKPLILVFSGSDWCGPCIRLERSIWSSETFKNYAAYNYVLYKADFPRKKKNQLPATMLNQNKNLAEKYNSKGHFPLVVVLDSTKTVLGTTGYKRVSPTAYIELLNAFVK